MASSKEVCQSALQLPASFSDLQSTITRCLVEHSCTARTQDTSSSSEQSTTAASQDCRICLEPLMAEQTLCHTSGGVTKQAESTSQPACKHHYHILCLTEWAHNNIRLKRPVTCPGDRQLLMPTDVSDKIYNDFELQTPVQHSTRSMDSVVRFWDCSYLVEYSENNPQCHFDVEYIHPESALNMASAGLDVGFVSGQVVDTLPLEDRAREAFIDFRDHDYNLFLYVETGRELVSDYDHDTGRETIYFTLSPVSRAVAHFIRRYLLGMLGEGYWINIPTRDSKIHATRMSFSDDEVINFHAETRLRETMLRSRSRQHISSTTISHCAFPNSRGGIVLGGVPDDDNYAFTNAYRFTGLNIGQANDLRFNALVRDSPELKAKQRSDNLVQMYNYTRLFHGKFPDHAVTHHDLRPYRPGRVTR